MRAASFSNNLASMISVLEAEYLYKPSSKLYNTALMPLSLSRQRSHPMPTFDKINTELTCLAGTIGIIDERVFNLGVELGKQLAAQGITEFRLPFFAEQKQDWTAAEAVLAIAEDVNDELSNLIRLAYKDHLSRHFSINFDLNPLHRNQSKLDDIAVTKFNVQHIYTLLDDGFDDFDLGFTATDELAKILQDHKVKTGFELKLRNNEGRTSKSITQRESLEDLFHGADVLFFSKDKSLLDYYALAHDLRRFCKKLIFSRRKR